MLLCVDVGNTQTVLGVYEQSHLRVMWRISSEAHRSADELKLSIKGLFALDAIDCNNCLLYTSPSPRDRTRSRMPSSA